MRYLAPLSLLVLSATLSVSAKAEQTDSRQQFNTVQYNTLENSTYDFDATLLSSHYYFAPQQHSGVWDDFGYLDTDTNIKLDYYNSDVNENFSLYGEGFFYDNWFAAAEIFDLSETGDFSVGAGYLFNDALKLSVRLEEYEDFDSSDWVKAQYNHQLNSTDYIGFTAETDDEVQVWNLSSRYFARLANDGYLAIDAGYNHSDFDSVFSALASYYFNRHLALGAGVDDSNLLVEAKYFIDSQYYFTANFTDFDHGDLYTVEFVAQF